MAKVFDADPAAQRLDGVHQVAEGVELLEDAVFSHLKQQPFAQVGVGLQQLLQFAAEVEVGNGLSRQVDRDVAGRGA